MHLHVVYCGQGICDRVWTPVRATSSMLQKQTRCLACDTSNGLLDLEQSTMATYLSACRSGSQTNVLEMPTQEKKSLSRFKPTHGA